MIVIVIVIETDVVEMTGANETEDVLDPAIVGLDDSHVCDRGMRDKKSANC